MRAHAPFGRQVASAKCRRSHASGGSSGAGLLCAGRGRARGILVLDAGFAPQPNLLKRMVGFVSDFSVCVVQSPQSFCNADPIPHNLHATQRWVDWRMAALLGGMSLLA